MRRLPSVQACCFGCITSAVLGDGVRSGAQVFSCSFTEAGRQENVVLKVMDMPKSIHDSCRQVRLLLNGPQ